MSGWGILGGTFNPPHNGHLECARHALAELELERLALMPVCLPPHKRGDADPGSEHRVKMCHLAIADAKGLTVSTLEVEREGPSYTVDTLRAIDVSDPGAELTFVVGADMARTLPSWRAPRELLRLARLAVAEREGAARREICEVLRSLGAEDRVVFLNMVPVDVSSSMVRDRVAAGDSIDGLVPAGVARYIADYGLYRDPGRAERGPMRS